MINFVQAKNFEFAVASSSRKDQEGEPCLRSHVRPIVKKRMDGLVLKSAVSEILKINIWVDVS